MYHSRLSCTLSNPVIVYELIRKRFSSSVLGLDIDICILDGSHNICSLEGALEQVSGRSRKSYYRLNEEGNLGLFNYLLSEYVKLGKLKKGLTNVGSGYYPLTLKVLDT